jgi:TatA/E family protein of Tat protein translocase
MFGIGMPEMLLILAVALIVIGPKKLPDLAKSLGKAMGEFKNATRDLKDSMQIDTELKEVKTAFDDMGKAVKKDTKFYTGDEESNAVEDVPTKETTDAGEEDPENSDTDPMEKLQAASDGQNTDTSESTTDFTANPDTETKKG